jgi:hypothetical protein
LHADGSLDVTFDPDVNNGIQGLAVQADGKILLGGGFTMQAEQPRSRIARITSGSPALRSLAIDKDGTAVMWSRSGSGPEAERVTFEASHDGTNYSALGNGTRIPNGWQLAGLSLPVGQNFYVRALARTPSGLRNGSRGLIETVAQFWRLPPPFISGVQVLGGGVFQFSFTNTNAVAFSVLASTNVAAPLASWENLGAPVSVGDGIYQFTDSGATNYARRFYQLRSP